MISYQVKTALLMLKKIPVVFELIFLLEHSFTLLLPSFYISLILFKSQPLKSLLSNAIHSKICS